MSNEGHDKEAREQLAGRIETMRVYLAACDVDIDDVRELNDDDETLDEHTAPNEFGTYRQVRDSGDLDGYDDVYDAVSEYGLSWEKYLTNHRDGTVTYEHVLSTGGPHDEFQVTFDPDDGSVTDVMFVYMPWFGRVEIALYENGNYAFGQTIEDVDVVTAFYETFYGASVETDREMERDR